MLRNVQAALKSMVDRGILTYAINGAPGASTGANTLGKGSEVIDTETGRRYRNFGSDASPTWRGDAHVSIAEVSLTAAQIKAVRATPITLVPAPGAGFVNVFRGAVLFLDAGTNGLTESTANLTIRYTDGSGATASETIESTGFIDQTGDTMTTARPKLDTIVAKAGVENRPLVLHNIGAGEIAGNAANDARLRVKVLYSVMKTDW